MKLKHACIASAILFIVTLIISSDNMPNFYSKDILKEILAILWFASICVIIYLIIRNIFRAILNAVQNAGRKNKQKERQPWEK